MLSIVLPCYNEAKGLPELLARFRPFAERYAFELILVDNGSTDETAQVLRALLADPAYRFARCHPLRPNQGYGGGILAGLRVARGEILAWSHADLQCAPGDLFAAYDKLMTYPPGAQVLIKGRRLHRQLNEQFITWGLQALATVVLWTPLHDINGQPKMFPRTLLQALPHPPADFALDLYCLYRARRAGWTIDTVPVDFSRRRHGVSHWAATWRSKWRTIRGFLRYLLVLRLQGGGA